MGLYVAQQVRGSLSLALPRALQERRGKGSGVLCNVGSHHPTFVGPQGVRRSVELASLHYI